MEFEKVQKGIFNVVSGNVKRLAELFPSVVKDGQVDFEALKSELGEFETVSDKLSEQYGLGWAGKEQANQLAKTDVIGRTLIYVPEDSKDTDTTENLYIEGDNLEVLKLLSNCYSKRIKMIYIDPPYNTGKDFIYPDKFQSGENANAIEEGDMDLSGERFIINQRSSGKYHANWLSIMYPRLKVAKELLLEDGLIFISIDENEYGRLKDICDEIFGFSNFIVDFVWQNKKGGGNDNKHIAIEHEYVVTYAKNKEMVDELYELYSEKYLERYKEDDDIGKFYWDTFKRKSGKQYYAIECPDKTILQYDDDGNPISWLRSEKRFLQDIKTGDARFVNIAGRWSVQFKQRLPKGKTPRSIYYSDTLINDKGTTSSGAADLFKLFGKDIFSNPKPVELLQYLLGFSLGSDDIALDFFSGSATLAEAVMLANANDGGKRKFILVQLQEDLDKILEKTEANRRLIIQNAINVLDELKKQHLITEIGKERIRRAGEYIKNENIDKEDINTVDFGFKVFKVADTNIRWFSEAIKSDNMTLEEGVMSDKDRLDFNPGYTDIDVVYEILLRHRDIPLSTNVEKLTSIGERTYIFADTVVVCLENDVNESIIDKIAAIEPMPTKVIFRDSAFGVNISLKTNSMLRLEAQMKKNSGIEKKAYRVEFI